MYLIASAGSSPHVRGTYHPRRRRAAHPRFIPARAGNIRGIYSAWRSSAVHPRTCGEHTKAITEYTGYNGSSPHVRGTSGAPDSSGRRRRFIPARAGNMPRSTSPNTGAPVHPRTCGEHKISRFKASFSCGSSPHVRGTYEPGLLRPLCFRFIPARAGNISTQMRHAPARSVHPRTCGEHVGKRSFILAIYGSSPHVRGTSAKHVRQLSAERFIPARAGNIMMRRERISGRPVHPRTCGEHIICRSIDDF